MKALGAIFYWTVVLIGMGLGASGNADKLILAICAFSAAVLLSRYFVFGPNGKVLTVTLPSLHHLSPEASLEAKHAFRFLGKALPLGDARIISLRLTRRNIGRVWGAIPFGLLLAFWNHGSNQPGHDAGGVFGAELAVVLCITMILNPAFQWFAECHLLNDARAVFTGNYVSRGSSLYDRTKYSFIDDQGDYRGGERKVVPSPWSNGELALVFYDPKNPDRNTANFGLRYTEVQWATLAEVAAAPGSAV
jgi:hypothetical protein